MAGFTTGMFHLSRGRKTCAFYFNVATDSIINTSTAARRIPHHDVIYLFLVFSIKIPIIIFENNERHIIIFFRLGRNQDRNNSIIFVDAIRIIITIFIV
jgi:hypothetical protein